ncbi:hypothetical protein KIPB_007275, partial [Kipferlia bialata]|eukprot:g7275.t1
MVRPCDPGHMIGSFFLLLAVSGILIAFGLPTIAVYIPGWVVYGIVGFTTVATCYLLLRTSLMDPGIIPRETELSPSLRKLLNFLPADQPITKQLSVATSRFNTKFCRTCYIYRPLRTSHCRRCDVCVRRFDHHCDWLGTDIGLRNYPWFVFFLISLALHVIISTVTCLGGFVAAWFQARAADGASQGFILYLLWFGWPYLVVGIVVSTMIVPTHALISFHFQLVTTNTTTREDLHCVFQGRVNPYDKGGRWANFKDVVFRKIEPSLLRNPDLACQRIVKDAEDAMAAGDGEHVLGVCLDPDHPDVKEERQADKGGEGEKGQADEPSETPFQKRERIRAALTAYSETYVNQGGAGFRDVVGGVSEPTTKPSSPSSSLAQRRAGRLSVEVTEEREREIEMEREMAAKADALQAEREADIALDREMDVSLDGGEMDLEMARPTGPSILTFSPYTPSDEEEGSEGHGTRVAADPSVIEDESDLEAGVIGVCDLDREMGLDRDLTLDMHPVHYGNPSLVPSMPGVRGKGSEWVGAEDVEIQLHETESDGEADMGEPVPTSCETGQTPEATASGGYTLVSTGERERELTSVEEETPLNTPYDEGLVVSLGREEVRAPLTILARQREREAEAEAEAEWEREKAREEALEREAMEREMERERERKAEEERQRLKALEDERLRQIAEEERARALEEERERERREQIRRQLEAQEREAREKLKRELAELEAERAREEAEKAALAQAIEREREREREKEAARERERQRLAELERVAAEQLREREAVAAEQAKDMQRRMEIERERQKERDLEKERQRELEREDLARQQQIFAAAALRLERQKERQRDKERERDLAVDESEVVFSLADVLKGPSPTKGRGERETGLHRAGDRTLASSPVLPQTGARPPKSPTDGQTRSRSRGSLPTRSASLHTDRQLRRPYPSSARAPSARVMSSSPTRDTGRDGSRSNVHRVDLSRSLALSHSRHAMPPPPPSLSPGARGATSPQHGSERDRAKQASADRFRTLSAYRLRRYKTDVLSRADRTGEDEEESDDQWAGEMQRGASVTLHSPATIRGMHSISRRNSAAPPALPRTPTASQPTSRHVHLSQSMSMSLPRRRSASMGPREIERGLERERARGAERELTHDEEGLSPVALELSRASIGAVEELLDSEGRYSRPVSPVHSTYSMRRGSKRVL